MKVEFELNLDKDGRPIIKFRHFDKSNDLEQKVLGVFVELVKENGCDLVKTGGFSNTEGTSFDNYEIKISRK